MNNDDVPLIHTCNPPARSYFTSHCPPNLPPPGEYNWDYGGNGDGGEVFECGDDGLFDFTDFGSFPFRQPPRRRPILPRTFLGRPIGPQETATTYKCSYNRKCYSKRCPIRPRDYFGRPFDPPSSCTMNQLSYTYLLRHRLWY